MWGEDHAPCKDVCPKARGGWEGCSIQLSSSAISPGSSDRGEGLLPLNSPEESSRLSVHTDLHVLEPEQTKGKRVLTVGSAHPLLEAWIKPSGQRGVQLHLKTAAYSPIFCGRS